MLSAEASYLFRHAAVRDVVYSLHLPSDRAELHRAALEALEQEYAASQDAILAELAVHAHHGREGLAGEEASRLATAEFGYLCRALKRHMERAQWQQAKNAAEQALATGCGTTPELCEVRLGHVQALNWLGRRADVIASAAELERLGRECASFQHIFASMTVTGLNLISLGDMARAREVLLRGIELADSSGTIDDRAKARMDISNLYTAIGDHQTQEAVLLEALALLGGAGSKHYWSIRGNLSNLYSGTGRIDEAAAILRAIIAEFSRSGQMDVNAWHMLGTAQVNLARQHLLKGELREAETLFRQGMETSAHIGKGSTAAFAQANLGDVHLQLGRFEQAEQAIVAAIDGAREFALPMYHAAYRCTLAELHLLRGHEAQAQELLEDARAEFISVGGEAYVPEYCGIARLRVAASRATSFPAPGRATSKLRATPPSASWLPVMRDIAQQIQKARDERGVRSSAPLDAAASDAATIVAEFELALKEKRPALVFRGHLPQRMRPDLRQSLVRRMNPGEAQMLQRLHPELWARMSA